MGWDGRWGTELPQQKPETKLRAPGSRVPAPGCPAYSHTELGGLHWGLGIPLKPFSLGSFSLSF